MIIYEAGGAVNFPTIVLVSDSGYPSTLGGDYPAVSGSIASLGLGQNATISFDLGPNWQCYRTGMFIINCGASPTNAIVTLSYCNDGVSSAGFAGIFNATSFASTIVNSVTVSNQYTVARFSIGSRYLRASATVGGSGNAYGSAAKMTVMAYPI